MTPGGDGVAIMWPVDFAVVAGPRALASWGAALLLVALAASCGGSSVPEGTPFAVQLEVVEPAPYGPHFPTPQPLAVAITNPEWARVSRLLPKPLPEPIDQG